MNFQIIFYFDKSISNLLSICYLALYSVYDIIKNIYGLIKICQTLCSTVSQISKKQFKKIHTKHQENEELTNEMQNLRMLSNQKK